MKPLEPQRSLMAITTDRIRDAIIAGELPLGSRLSEVKLAEMLGISRSPVHNALSVLQQEGLVVVQPKVGSFVFTPSIKDALDLCEHRSVLECASLSLALKRDPGRLVEGLEARAEHMQEAARHGDSAGYTANDIAFHAHIIACSNNASMIRTYPSTIGPLMALRSHLFTEMHGDMSRSLAEHEALIDACRRQDVHEASQILSDHIGQLVVAYQAAQDAAASASGVERPR